MPLKSAEQSDWYATGQSAYHEGLPRVAAPSAPAANEAWCRGWDAANKFDEAEKDDVIDMAIRPVQLRVIGGNLLLTDMDGNRIGNQRDVIIEQGVDGTAATVTFIDVPIVAG